MSDTAWKPKRVSGGTTDSPIAAFKVELSIHCAETKKTLEEIVAGTKEFQVKDGKDTTSPSILILELEDNPEETYSVIRDLTKVARGTEIFLTASNFESAVLLEAMRAGAKEFLSQPIRKNEVDDAFARFQARVIATPETSSDIKKEGKILAFFGGKGGVGTTCVAVNTAAALMRLPNNPSVVLVDVNQHGGDLPLYLDLQPSHSFRDIAADPSRLDQAFLFRILTKDESGLQVLASGYDDLSTGRLSPDCVESTLRILQTNFDYVVIDCGYVMDLTTKKAIELSSGIWVVSSLLVPVVHRTKRILDLLRGSGYGQEKVKLIFNRYSPEDNEVLRETEDALKCKASWVVPNDYPSASGAINNGTPVSLFVPKTPIAKCFHEVATSICQSPHAKKDAVPWVDRLRGIMVGRSKVKRAQAS